MGITKPDRETIDRQQAAARALAAYLDAWGAANKPFVAMLDARYDFSESSWESLRVAAEDLEYAARLLRGMIQKAGR